MVIIASVLIWLYCISLLIVKYVFLIHTSATTNVTYRYLSTMFYTVLAASLRAAMSQANLRLPTLCV